MSHCSCVGTYDCGCMDKVEFCASKLAKPEVFCTLRPKHSGPCSFYLSGSLADIAIAELRAELKALKARFASESQAWGEHKEQLHSARLRMQSQRDLLRSALSGILESTCGNINGQTGPCLSTETWTKAEDALRGIE